jgi:hypothetical protein
MTHTYKTHYYDNDGVLTIKSDRDLTILASQDEELVLVVNSRHTLTLPSSDPLNLAKGLANIIFDNEMEYAS